MVKVLKSYLRSVSMNDIDVIYKWSNDSYVRSQSFSSEEIKYSDHVKWFNNILNSKNVFFGILNVDNHDVGQIRLKMENNRAIISYSIACEYRKKGYGELILSLAEEKIVNVYRHVMAIEAEVKKDNEASNKLFNKLGYKLKQTNSKCNTYEKVINKQK